MNTIREKKTTYQLIIGFTIAFTLFISGTSHAQEVRAAFSCDLRDGDAPLEVSLIDETSGAAVRRLWDFGDGSTGTGDETDHRYEEPGCYYVTLTIRDPVTGEIIDEVETRVCVGE